jgi:lysyl-tRNA synthetase, class II
MEEIRLKKLEELQQKGIYPWGRKFDKTDIATIRENFEEKKSVKTAGRIASKREHGKTFFSDIKDSTGKIQLYFRINELGIDSFNLAKELDIGDIIGVEGELFKTHTGELTIFVKRWELLTKSLRVLPEKWHGLKDPELVYRKRYLDLLANPSSFDRFKRRIEIVSFIREFFKKEGFLEVETPLLHPIAGGATARPFVTYHNALDCNLYLRIAPELYLKRLLVGGFEKVFEIGKNFRNEGISYKHNPEFTMLEAYACYKNYQDGIELIKKLFLALAENFTNNKAISYRNNVINLGEFRIISYKNAIKEYTGIDYEDKERVINKLKELNLYNPNKSYEFNANELFEKEVEAKLIQPTFVIDYPKAISPLAKETPDNQDIVERFEFFIGGMEIVNAFSELNNPQEQKARFLQQLKEKEEGYERLDEDFIEALEYGMPPAVGLGLGIDRVVMLLTQSDSIKDVILFPTLKPLDSKTSQTSTESS